jgi:hypothetical protein
VIAALSSVHALVHELQCAAVADASLITGTGRRIQASAYARVSIPTTD